MKPGDEFNPWRGACGFYPPDVVGQQKTLTDGQKRAYERLVRFAGQNGDCFPQLQTLADELGKSLSQVKRDVGRLEEIRLVAHKSRAGRKSNTYVFLWHAWFDGSPKTSQIGQNPSPLVFESSPMSLQSKNEGPSVTSQTRSEHSDELSREFTGDRLKVRPRPSNSVQELNTGKTSSSSSREFGRLREERASANSTTVTTALSLQDERKSPSEVWWTSEDVAAAVAELQRAAGQWRLLRPPDVGLVLAILPCMVSLDDLRLWLQSSASLLGNAKSWGLYVADAQRWPERRAKAQIQQKRESFAFEQEQRRADEALSQLPQESSPEFINVAVASEPVVPHCRRCNDFGVVGGFSGPAEWCDCEHALRRRERDPNYIESYNARCAKTWSNAGGSRQLGSQRMTA